MATWSKPLPGTASEGSTSHVQDHNKLTEAMREVRTVVDGISVPDVSDLAEKVYVDNAIAGIDVPSLDGYATEAFVNDAVAGTATGDVDLTEYAKKTDIPAAPDLTPYAKKSDLPNVSGLVSGTGVAAIKVCTEAEYDALTPDASTLYVIREA